MCETFMNQGKELVVELPMTIEEKYEQILQKSRAGGCGNYQVISTVGILCGIIGQAFLDYNIAYLIMFPQFVCTETGNVCTAEDICAG